MRFFLKRYKTFIHGNASENIVCKKAAILFGVRWVNHLNYLVFNRILQLESPDTPVTLFRGVPGSRFPSFIISSSDGLVSSAMTCLSLNGPVRTKNYDAIHYHKASIFSYVTVPHIHLYICKFMKYTFRNNIPTSVKHTRLYYVLLATMNTTVKKTVRETIIYDHPYTCHTESCLIITSHNYSSLTFDVDSQ